MIVDVRVDRNALVLLLRTGDYHPGARKLLTLSAPDRWELVAIDFYPPASGPEAQLSYRPQTRDGKAFMPEDSVKSAIQRAGLAVLASRVREEG